MTRWRHCDPSFQVKEVIKYTDDLHKTHKQVKDEETATADAVKLLQVRFDLRQVVCRQLNFTNQKIVINNPRIELCPPNSWKKKES